MSQKINLHLLILCGILSQGIIATSGKDTRESSDFLARKKRVITDLLDGNTRTPMNKANYIVDIKRLGISTCVGAILSHYTVITSDTCFFEHEDLKEYTILSGGGNDILINFHEITSKTVYYGNPIYQLIDGVALITVNPRFVYGKDIEHIPLHLGSLPEGTLVTVSGWGSCYPLPSDPARIWPLSSITIPIMSHAECANVYRHNHDVQITEKHICTYDEKQYCDHSDVGTPLVFNRHLVGIHVWKGERKNQRNPEVFLNLQRPEYNDWIRENTLAK